MPAVCTMEGERLWARGKACRGTEGAVVNAEDSSMAPAPLLDHWFIEGRDKSSISFGIITEFSLALLCE